VISIDRGCEKLVLDHVSKGYPHEACGILAGKDRKVLKVYTMANLSDTPRIFYYLDPAEQLKVFKDIRQRGMEMLGHYHSHVDSEAYPSERDIKLAFYPESLMVIVGVTSESPGALKGFRVVEGRVKEEELAVDSSE